MNRAARAPWLIAAICLLAPAALRAATCADIGAGCVPLTACGEVDGTASYYLLSNDLRADRSCLTLKRGTYTLDLNSRTITYSDLSFSGVQNPGFEEAEGTDPQKPAGWELSNFPTSRRQSYEDKLFYDDHSLRLERPANGADVTATSSQVSLPAAGRYAVFASVNGGPYGIATAAIGVTGLAVTCDNRISNQHSVYENTDMSTGIICEFEIAAPAQVRARMTLSSTDPARATTLHVDEMDIRPIGDSAIEPKAYDPVVVEIRNGTVLEGRAQGIFSPAIKIYSGGKVKGLHVTTNGVDAPCIYGMWHGDIEIADNTLTANGRVPFHRHYPFAMINITRTEGGLQIHDNLLLNGPHVGILTSDATGGKKNAKKSVIRDNTIKTKIVATNGFAIAASSNTEIFNNTIQPVQGHGIAAGSYQEIHHNRIEPRSWPCSEYARAGYPNSAHGIRIKTYGSGAMRDLSIHDNTIIGRTNPQRSNCYTEVSGITNYITDFNPLIEPNLSNNRIFNNIVDVATDDPEKQDAIALKNEGTAEIFGNTFKSNHIAIEMSDADSCLPDPPNTSGCQSSHRGGGENNVLTGNQIIKAEGATSFHTLRCGYFRGNNNTFLDTRLEGGADLKDVLQLTQYPAPGIDHKVAWVLTVKVLNSAGDPVQGAHVLFLDKNGQEVKRGTTDADGTAVADLVEYNYVHVTSPAYTYFSPYTVKVGELSAEVALTASMTVTFRGDQYTVCGNGVVEAGEACDQNDLAGASCASQGFDQGTLACTSACTYDLRQCQNENVDPLTDDDNPAVASGCRSAAAAPSALLTALFLLGLFRHSWRSKALRPPGPRRTTS